MGKWMFAGYTLAAGILMSIFIMTEGPTKHIFSLGAILIGFSVFRRVEEKKPIIWFVVLVVLLALVLPLIYTVLALANGWYINPDLLKE